MQIIASVLISKFLVYLWLGRMSLCLLGGIFPRIHQIDNGNLHAVALREPIAAIVPFQRF